MAPPRINSTKATVLVVDDSPEMLRYLRLMLELDSYRVETASNGIEALQRLRDGYDPQVVLLDVQMPGMDGLMTLHYLRQLRPRTKVIMCSGLDDAAKRQRAAELGAEAYLTKPVQQLYLSAALERCLRTTPGRRKSVAGRNVLTLPLRSPYGEN